jgi:hypothetical protein
VASHPQHGPPLKIERAKKHIRDLNSRINEFLATNPYRVVLDEDSEPGKKLYKLSRVDPVPPGIGLIAGDAIHNLRSALDHMFCQLVVANNKVISRTDMLPIADSAQIFKSGGIPKIKGRVTTDAAKLIAKIKPYKGGHCTKS